ncbi:AAA family ATPase [Candidatus Woesebacteria bacterium]|nr:AAA family ATPase [Candidatus Woesebacteria bacterium]
MSTPTNWHYNNITISGLPGSGSTTLLKYLKKNEELKFAGWKGFSGGEFMRAYAEEKGLFQKEGGLHHFATHYEDEFDLQVDMGMRTKLQEEKNWILESWLSGFLAQQVPGVLKILMRCSNKAVRVDRIVNRDGVTPEQALHNMQQRYEENRGKWQRLYADKWEEWVVRPGTRPKGSTIDFWHEDLYDVVIDTYSHNQQEVMEIVLDAIKKN